MARNKPNQQRVFCIGWHKTGTSSIGVALIRLGYSVLGARLDMSEYLFEGHLEPVLQLAKKFDALQDVPWCALYKELDEHFPNSKFILTEREDDKWLHSAGKHFGNDYTAMREWLYGKGELEGNEDLYMQRYREHNESIKEYFKDRSENLLVMNFELGDGWEKLCPFLGHSVPRVPFPHANKGKHSYNRRDKIIHRIREWTPGPIQKALFYSKLTLLKPFGYRDPRNRFNNFPQNRNELINYKRMKREDT